MSYTSHRVNREHQAFVTGVRNRYSALFIRGVIKKPNDFHQQFDLYVKLRPKEIKVSEHNEESEKYLDPKHHSHHLVARRISTTKQYGDTICAPLSRFSKLNENRFGKVYNFPSRRDPVKGCNDICRHCAEWCFPLDSEEPWGRYVCLIGHYRRNPAPERDRPWQVDPMDAEVATYPYPFVCWKCYTSEYRNVIEKFDGQTRFLHRQFDIDHAFIMNVDPYLHTARPTQQQRRHTWNNAVCLEKMPLSVLENLLQNDGLFALTVDYVGGGDLNCQCHWCGREISHRERARYIGGCAVSSFPVRWLKNGAPQSNNDAYDYEDFIWMCRDCFCEISPADDTILYPFGTRFKVEYNADIND